MTFLKFCGMTREDDVRRACDLGVDALGFVTWPGSPRHVDAAHLSRLIAAMTVNVTPVAVMVSPSLWEIQQARDAGAAVIQLHGDMVHLPAGDVWIASSLERDLEDIPRDVTLVLDAHDPLRHGGTGRTIDWNRAAAIAAVRPVMLAGGLTPGNVAGAVRQVRPFGVDVASGIEERPGIKDARAMTEFAAAVRKADA